MALKIASVLNRKNAPVSVAPEVASRGTLLVFLKRSSAKNMD